MKRYRPSLCFLGPMVVSCFSLSFQVLAAPTVSVGTPQHGALLHPVVLRSSKYINARAERNYGTKTLIKVIESALRHVHQQHPETPKIYVGDLSDHDGGHLGRHVSHQSGRDADIAYFRDGPLHEEDRLIKTTPEQLDLYRTWTLIAYLIDHPDVQAIYSDAALIKKLHQHAQDIGHTDAELSRFFGPKVGSAYSGSKLRHSDGHMTHFHLRVRAGGEQREWSEIKNSMEPERFALLKRHTLKPHERTPQQAFSVQNITAQPTLEHSSRPRRLKRRVRSEPAMRARALAQRARQKAKLRSARARARRRLATRRSEPVNQETATSERDKNHEASSQPPEALRDDRITQGGRSTGSDRG